MSLASLTNKQHYAPQKIRKKVYLESEIALTKLLEGVLDVGGLHTLGNISTK